MKPFKCSFTVIYLDYTKSPSPLMQRTSKVKLQFLSELRFRTSPASQWVDVYCFRGINADVQEARRPTSLSLAVSSPAVQLQAARLRSPLTRSSAAPSTPSVPAEITHSRERCRPDSAEMHWSHPACAKLSGPTRGHLDEVL